MKWLPEEQTINVQALSLQTVVLLFSLYFVKLQIWLLWHCTSFDDWLHWGYLITWRTQPAKSYHTNRVAFKCTEKPKCIFTALFCHTLSTPKFETFKNHLVFFFLHCNGVFNQTQCVITQSTYLGFTVHTNTIQIFQNTIHMFWVTFFLSNMMMLFACSFFCHHSITCLIELG